ncbi:DUF5131 family protein [Saccharopolyspora sp. NPDC002376]
MSTSTGIEWTESTWNPITGCTKVSPGCDNCYALTLAERFRGTPGHYFENGFDVQLRPDKLTEPLKWRKPRKVFVNSMSDLFHQDVPNEYIAQVFAVMAATPQHTYQILTKRHGRMRSFLRDECKCGSGHAPGVHLRSAMEWASTPHSPTYVPGLQPGIYHGMQWPLPNVWLGVSVEDQKRADLRIPALLDTPARVRFLSCEPLVGPVDLSQWMPPISPPMDPANAPESWSDWTWPDWVPQAVRDQIEDFWGPKSARTPQQWIRDMHVQGSHPFGATVTSGDGFGHNPPQIIGRWVHAWNNIGRLAHEDGTFSYTSFSQRAVREQRLLDWIICGGESGPKARPMHPGWARSLRDQCTAADVPFFFKQFGEWAPESVLATARGAASALYIDQDGSTRPAAHGTRNGAVTVQRNGKRNTGRVLDGRTWDEFPTAGKGMA